MKNNTASLIALAGYLFAAIFICAGYFLRSKLRRHLHGAVVTKGTIVSVESATSMGSDSIGQVFHPVFTFKDAQGTEHRVRSAVGTFPATHKTGDAVEVFYNPQSPKEAMIDPKGFIQMFRICFFAGGLGVIVATVIFIFGR